MEAQHDELLAHIGEAIGIGPDELLPPVAVLYGLSFFDYEEKKHLLARCEARKAWATADNEVHRETLMAAAGLCAETLAIALAKKRCALMSTEAQFFRAVTADGRDMTIEARLKATRGSIIFCETIVKCIDSKLSARMMYQYAVLKHAIGSGQPAEEADE
jgi:hypothetical protein